MVCVASPDHKPKGLRLRLSGRVRFLRFALYRYIAPILRRSPGYTLERGLTDPLHPAQLPLY